MSGAQAGRQPRIARLRPMQRMELVDKVSRELQSRFRYHEIDEFLAAFGVSPPTGDIGTNSKWVYSKAALRDVTDALLFEIAGELELGPATAGAAIPPRNWQSTTEFRLFISHISEHKLRATRLKTCLSPYYINGFVAHEDIHPTLEWQVEIERALHVMDAFIAIHTKGFSASFWTQQEVGFAVGRGVKIISLKMGEDPTGFISKHQALARGTRTAEEIAKEVDSILADDARTAERLAAAKKANTAPTVDDEIPF